MVTLCILDGFGISDKVKGNAVIAGGTPFLDKLKKEYPNTQIEASGEAVGLPAGQMGNSEVGHLTIGGGRVIEQDLLHIDNEIKNGNFAKNKSLVKAMKYAEQNGTLHLIGLLSSGGVHSKIEHMFAILDVAKNYNIKNIYIHAITDGRDTAVTSGKEFLEETEKKIAGTNAHIATIEFMQWIEKRDTIDLKRPMTFMFMVKVKNSVLQWKQLKPVIQETSLMSFANQCLLMKTA